MVMSKNKLYITDVDPSKNARYRRIGLDKFTHLIRKDSDKSEDKLIPWSYVQALPSNIGGFKGDVKLNPL
jgi:hypothetical protein